MASVAPPSADWQFSIDEPTELAFDEAEVSTMYSQIEVSNSPIDLKDGLGIRFCEPEDLELPEVLKQSSTSLPSVQQDDSQRKRINQHIYELLQANDKRREKRKRIRFDDMGASPRKRARLADRMETLLEYESDVPDLTTESDLLKLQMIALSAHEQEKESLLSIIEGLEKEIKRLVHLNVRQSEKRAWIVREVIRGRATTLREHSDFLKSVADKVDCS